MTDKCVWCEGIMGRAICVEGDQVGKPELCAYDFDQAKCPKFITPEQLKQREAEAARAEAAAREEASKRAITARIQAMLAAARKEIEQLRRMLIEAGEKHDTAGAAICLRTLAEIEMAAADRAMNYARERIIDDMLANAARKKEAPGA